MKTKKILALLISGVFATTMASQGAVMIMHTDTFRVVDTDDSGTGDVVQNSFLNAGNNVFDTAVVSSFEMTGFSSGAEIGNVDFSITRKNGGAGDPNLSLDVLRTSSSPTINTGDYEFVAAANLMTEFADGAINTSYSLDASGQAALTTYLQSNWVENDYVFLRIRSGVIGPAPEDASYFFGGNSSQSDAQLTLTAVPEPSSTALLGLGGLALMLRRKRS